MEELTTFSSLNEYGFESYSFPAEVAERDDLQALDLEFCKFAQATGTNYIEMCKRVATIHAKLARAGRYGGGQWLAWCKVRGLGKDTAYRMTTIGDNFNVRNLKTLNALQLENMPKSLLYAASKGNASPVTWELLSSSDPKDVEVGKGLLEAEKHLDAAREEFRLALDAAKKWYAIEQQHPGMFAGKHEYEIMRQIAQCNTVAEVETLVDERLNKFCTEKPLDQRTPEEISAFFNLEI